MLNLTINNKPIQFPTSWAEVTVRQFFAIKNIDPNDKQYNAVCKMLEVFTGIKAAEWFDMEATEVDTNTILLLLEFCKDPINWESLKKPESITVQGKEIKIPTDISLSTYGQIVVFDTTVIPKVHESGNIIDVVHTAVAIFIQPLITGKKFDGNKLSETESMVLDLPIYQVFPLASFFLREYFSYLIKSESSSIEHQLVRKSKPELIS